MAAAKQTQPLPSKEQTLFKHLVQHYETKQYKKGLKAAEQILKKHPSHGETQAMKALILNSQGKNEEAMALGKEALNNAMKSNVCWHVYGLLYRSVKNYDPAIKAYKYALKLEPDSVQIQRDLALLQVQMRDYAGFVQSRRTMLNARPGFRQNWTALAVALHLSGDLEAAEDVLQKYEDTLKQPPSKTDMEHAEAVLYKNSVIAEQGDLQRALEHLEGVSKNALDRVAVMEMKADYLLRLDRRKDAEAAYRALLNRNPEKRAYYDALEKALGLSRDNKDDVPKLLEMYKEYASKSERIDAARRIPLDFLTGDEFKQHADAYLRRMFAKGVPSTFANVKQLYTDPSKMETFQQLAEGYLSEDAPAAATSEGLKANGSINGETKSTKADPATTWQMSITYFLAQHYDYHLSRDLSKAQQHIDKTISLNPKKNDYTFHMTGARIMKHQGDVQAASKAMNEAREMDLKDRYINTKCAKYQLRNEEHENAISTMGLFTRKEAVGGPLGDLIDMQCVWFLTEDGESFMREGKLSMALKRFRTVYDIFETWTEDQFDFHTFSLRKGMVRAYIDMIRWEDQLREHPFFTRAALSAIKIYCMLHDNPQLAKGGVMNGTAGMSEAEQKKAAKKAKREAEKAEAERKLAAAKKANPKPDEDGVLKKEDPDPQGLELIKTEKPLEEAMKFVTPMLEMSPKNVDVQIAGFEVFVRRKLPLPALKCLLSAYSLDPDHPKCHEQGGRFKLMLDKLETPLPPSATEAIQKTYLSRLSSKSLAECNEEYLSSHPQSAPHIQSVVRFRQTVSPGSADTKTKGSKDLLDSLGAEKLSLEDAMNGLQLVDELDLGADARTAYVEKARAKWPQASAFRA